MMCDSQIQYRSNYEKPVILYNPDINKTAKMYNDATLLTKLLLFWKLLFFIKMLLVNVLVLLL